MNLSEKFKKWFGVFMGAGVMTMVRGNALLAVVMLLMSNSGTWKYFASTITAYDSTLAAHWAQGTSPLHLPLVIAIDDEGYRRFFNSRSPVSRGQMLALLQVIEEHTPATTKIAIDIDLSPTDQDHEAQQKLDAFFLNHPGKWILPAVQQGTSSKAGDVRAWRQHMCQHGVVFGLPYVPTEFGYPKMTHQYQHGLADALAHRNSACVDPDVALVQIPMPLLASSLDAASVIPFTGDLALLATMLDVTQPEALLLGGMWGQNDLFGTPFGERYGVLLHNAALAGELNGERLAPKFFELLVTWIFLSCMRVILFYLCHFLDGLSTASLFDSGGKKFFTERAKPIVFVIVVLICLCSWVTLVSLLHAMTGFWINSAQVCAATILYTMITWNFGREIPLLYASAGIAWDKVVKEPISHDIFNMRKSVWLLFSNGSPEPETTANEAASLSLALASHSTFKRRVLFEFFCAFFSLLLQTLIPLASTIYLISKLF